ncbi:hypothetical protein AAC387_Pa12g1346 [Persea americana]
MAAKKMSLKLVVDKEKNRVVFAESGSDFVDVLLSFLTMPIGTVMRLTGKESKIAGMSTLYESVEDLDLKLLQTEACKKMLLKPTSASEDHCRNLKVNVDDTEPTKYYSCSFGCCPEGHNYVSTSCNSQCLCGKFTGKMKIFDENVGAYSNDGVFVKGNMRFIIRDHLEVHPVSMTSTFALLNELGITDASVLEERSLNVGAAEVMSLLNRTLLSKTPLTDVFLRDQDKIDRENHDFKASTHHLRDLARPQEEKGNDSDSKKIKVKLTVKKSDNKAVYAECREQFTDLLFSFPHSLSGL